MAGGARTLVFVNGASGSGKTSVASLLDEAHGFNWFHPDGAWDTPAMDQRVLTHECINFAALKLSGTVVIDSQLRQEYLDDYEGESLNLRQVLLDCDQETRAIRLQTRKWPSMDIDAHIKWASFLKNDATSANVPIFDTSAASIYEVTLGVAETIISWETEGHLTCS